MLLSGCGGSAPPSVAGLGTTTRATTATTSTSASGSNGAVGSSGGGASTGGGKVGAAFSVAGTAAEMTNFAACMRASGEPTFPDPNAQGVISAGSLDRGSPQFEHALESCRKDLPGGNPTPAQQARDVTESLELSACMRRNGVPDFPDPQTGPNGQSVIRIGPNSGIDPQSPQYQRAQQICGSTFPGTGKG